MQIIFCITLAMMGSVTFGTDGNDVPVAARILDDGTCAVILQSSPAEGPMSYSITLVREDSEPDMDRLHTGMEDPTWTRGCGFLSDDAFALQLASWITVDEFSAILVYQGGTEPSDIAWLPQEGSLDSGADGYTVLSSILALPGDSGYLMTTDLIDPDYDELVRKDLYRLGASGDTIWASEVPVEGYWMNPDVIRSMPDGGCVVASDEDGFSGILQVSRFDRIGDLLWSTQVDAGGEMTHSVLDILPAADGGILLVAETDLFQMQSHCLLVMIDKNGNVVSEVLEEGLGHMSCTDGIRLEDGGYLLAGWTAEQDQQMMHSFDMVPVLVRLDSAGEVLGWETYPGPLSRSAPRFLLETPDGFAMIGNCWDENGYSSAEAFVEFVDIRDIPSGSL